jgi:hypothetical protein
MRREEKAFIQGVRYTSMATVHAMLKRQTPPRAGMFPGGRFRRYR